MSRLSSDASLFGFDSDDWLERLRRNERGESLGALGPYELIAVAGRGGQGVVYRARQPATGRVIAVKRLLAGRLSSPESLRRFELEIQASSALNHPGIVAVYGVDFVEGTPLLAMEWVEGVPVTQWALGRARAEILSCFLSVCDAVQHAHQRGVLHRDVKPSNVLVDTAGRARLLDFGLARLVQADSSVTISGAFVGTPAYAAPEQLEGGELDVRADVYSLGAILFEMLTGRRLFEGEGLDVLVRAARTPAPTRPSSLVRSIPRDLDAIVLQAVAHERAQRYQSVDALAADLRRFLAGAPVLAQPPSAWYLLRKLVARNRLASALVAALVLGSLAAGVAYAVVSARHARRLTAERDRALAASAAADRARQETEDQRRLAETARDAAQREERRARDEKENMQAMLSFFLYDVLAGVNPIGLDHQPSLLELLQSAAPRIAVRFGHSPFVEARVRGELGIALANLGDIVTAERELRTALATRTQDPSATPAELADLETTLGSMLVELGQYEEAERVLLSAEAHMRADGPRSSNFYRLYGALTKLYSFTRRPEDCERTIARQLECARNERERVAALGSRAALKVQRGRLSEAMAEIDTLLPEVVALFGEDSGDVGALLDNRGVCRLRLHDLEGAEADMRRALAILTRVYGPDHTVVGGAMGTLASILVESGRSQPEAEELARRCVEINRATSSNNVQLASSLEWLAGALAMRRDFAGATTCMLEALALHERLFGRGDRMWVTCATDAVLMLARDGLTDEANELVEQVATHPFGPSPGLALRFRATIEEQRGNLEEALGLYDQAIALLRADRRDQDALPAAFADFAALLRELGDEEGAVEVERQAAEVRSERAGLPAAGAGFSPLDVRPEEGRR